MGLLILNKRKMILDYLDQSISILPAGEKDSARESKEQVSRKGIIASLH